MKLPGHRYDALKELFGRALECAPSEREAFILRETEETPELRGALLRLLVEVTASAEAEFGALRSSPQLERYELGEVIGEGGGGIVFEAWQRQPRRKVAIKLLRAHGSISEQRFLQEIEILGQLSHPGIVQIIEGGVTDGGQSFYVCELVPGARSITEYIQVELLGLPQRLDLFAQVCAAVAYAHERGVLHLDLKPSNVLVDRDGRVRVIDFGIAKLAAELDGAAAPVGERASHAPSAGSLASMAPEQARGGPSRLASSTDVYALGLLLFELVTGEPARTLDGCDLARALRLVREGDLPRVVARAGELSPAVRLAIESATRIDPAARVRSPVDLARLALTSRDPSPGEARPGSWTVACACALLVGAAMTFDATYAPQRRSLEREQEAGSGGPVSASATGSMSLGSYGGPPPKSPQTEAKPLDTPRRGARSSGSKVFRERDRAWSFESKVARARERDHFAMLAEQTEQLWEQHRMDQGSLMRDHRLADYAILCFLTDREEEALRLAREALESPQMRPLRADRLRAMLGWILLRRGAREEARAVAVELAGITAGQDRLEESRAQAEIMLGVLRAQDGEEEAGRAAATEGLRTLEAVLLPLDPRLDWAREALAALDRRR
ncbi:MAG: serine/threonine protein kinase [Planctomycetes bacterium]|nr:serine/threonine protein kinase [Planctomycetota bacterium]